MALPFWLPFALMGASTVVNTIAARQSDRAMADVMAAERARQNEFSNQQFGIFEDMGGRVGEYDARAGERRTALEDMFTTGTEGAAPAPVQTALPQSDSSLVVNREAAERGEARDFTDQQGRALANMRSFGDVFDMFGRENTRDMGDLGIIQSFRRGSQSVLPMDLEGAKSKGQGLRTLGDLFSAGASMTMFPGLMAPAPAAATSLAPMTSRRPLMRPF